MKKTKESMIEQAGVHEAEAEALRQKISLYQRDQRHAQAAGLEYDQQKIQEAQALVEHHETSAAKLRKDAGQM
jgi:hypothetical protein